MGIFGNDNNSSQSYGPADNVNAGADNSQAQSTYIDGVMAPQGGNDDRAMQQSVNDYMSQTAPPLNDQPQPSAEHSQAVAVPVTTHSAPAGQNSPPVHPQQSQPAASVHQPADDLSDIKQQALQQLSPLVGHLDQSPEEKFHTTMMMLQATDNESLIKSAFDAAKDISDDKARAQALMDVINEINYFTQSKHQ